MAEQKGRQVDGVLRFALTKSSAVRAALFDASGRRVRTLLDGASFGPGRHGVALSAGTGAPLGPGLYFYRVESAEGVLSGRFAFVR